MPDDAHGKPVGELLAAVCDRRVVAGLAPRATVPRRVLILTAAVGDGHLSTASALAAELTAFDSSLEVIVADALHDLGRVLRVLLLDLYRWQLDRAPWVFGLLYHAFRRLPPLRLVGQRGLAVIAGRSVLRAITDTRPDVVVSTYPAMTAVIGGLRASHRLKIPAVAAISDLAGVEFWAHRGIDLHLVMHPGCVAAVERVAGSGSALCVRPLVRPGFYAQEPQAEARRSLGFDADTPLVLVSGGGWGVGALEAATQTALATREDARIICLAGRDPSRESQLRVAFKGIERVNVLGFTEMMPPLLAAADVLIHTTGGVTCLEAQAAGCPVIAFGGPPGHSRLLAREMARLGIAVEARTIGDLADALRLLAQSPRSGSAERAQASAVTSILGIEARDQPKVNQLRRSVVALSVAASIVIAIGALHPI